MSGLKEEWASIVNLRESNRSGDSQIDQVRSRIFNNFYSSIRTNTKNSTDFSDLFINSELKPANFGIQRGPERAAKTPEPQKKFEFGLKSSNNLEIPAIKEKTPVKVQEVWQIEDFPQKDFHENLVPDRFEVLSVAARNSSSKMVKVQGKEICIFKELSPISRYMCNLTFEEEEKLLNQSKHHEKHMDLYIQLLHQDIPLHHLDKIDWKIATKICLGNVFKCDILEIVSPPQTDIETAKDFPSKCVSENLVTEKSVLKAPNHFESLAPLVEIPDENSFLEKEMIEMMDTINLNQKSSKIKDKLQSLLEIVEQKIKTNEKTSKNMHIRVLYQFLLEYKKAKESPKKILHPNNPPFQRNEKKKMTQPTRLKNIKNSSSKSSIKSEKISYWNRGKYQDDFDDNDSISLNQTKKRTETRNEIAYKK
jgi:hypothetical protein